MEHHVFAACSGSRRQCQPNFSHRTASHALKLGGSPVAALVLLALSGVTAWGRRYQPMFPWPDYDFAQLMVDHHQAAIDNSEALLIHGRETTTRTLAQTIITDQRREIAML